MDAMRVMYRISGIKTEDMLVDALRREGYTVSGKYFNTNKGYFREIIDADVNFCVGKIEFQGVSAFVESDLGKTLDKFLSEWKPEEKQ